MGCCFSTDNTNMKKPTSDITDTKRSDNPPSKISDDILKYQLEKNKKKENLNGDNNKLNEKINELKFKIQKWKGRYKKLSLKNSKTEDEIIKENHELKERLSVLESQITKSHQSLSIDNFLIEENKKLKQEILQLQRDLKTYDLLNGENTVNFAQEKTKKDFYDTTIDISLNKNTWKVLEKNKNYKIHKEYCVIGFLGKENIGKTFILNKFLGELPVNLTPKTKGLCLKYDIPKKMLFLDYKGEDGSIKYSSDKSNQNLEKINKRTSDCFVREFVIKYSQILVIVVDYLTEINQIFIAQFEKKKKKNKKIIIIHNFSRVLLEKDLISACENNINSSFEITNAISKNEFVDSEKRVHLVLSPEWTEAGKQVNDKTMKRLKEILEANFSLTKFKLKKELLTFFQENCDKYLKYTSKNKGNEKLKLNYDKKNGNFFFQSDVDCEILEYNGFSS